MPDAPRRRIITLVRAHPLLFSVLVLIVLMPGLRLWWGWTIQRTLKAQHEQIRARGGAVTVAELNYQPVPDDRNAWTLQSQAMGLVRVDSPRNSVHEFGSYPPHGRLWEKLARESEEKNAGVFPLMRQARQLKQASVLREIKEPLHRLMLSHLNGARMLANVTVDGAEYAHLRGNDAEAIERLRDGLHLQRSINQDPSLVGQLVATGIGALVTETTFSIAPTLQFASQGTNQPASQQQVQELIAEFLDDQAAREAFCKSFAFERLFHASFQELFSQGTWMIKPLSAREQVRNNENIDIYLEAARHDNVAMATEFIKKVKIDATSSRAFSFPQSGVTRTIPRYSRWFSIQYSPNRAIETQFRHIAVRRAAAVSLAAQLYRHDHGRWPDDLKQLVPNYLPHVPTDPFHADGRPLGYVVHKAALPNGRDRPMVYFDPGETEDVVIRDEPIYGWVQDRRPGKIRRVIRQHRDLAHWVPAVRSFDPDASSEAVDDDPYEADAPGEESEENDEAD